MWSLEASPAPSSFYWKLSHKLLTLSPRKPWIQKSYKEIISKPQYCMRPCDYFLNMTGTRSFHCSCILSHVSHRDWLVARYCQLPCLMQAPPLRYNVWVLKRQAIKSSQWTCWRIWPNPSCGDGENDLKCSHICENMGTGEAAANRTSCIFHQWPGCGMDLERHAKALIYSAGSFSSIIAVKISLYMQFTGPKLGCTWNWYIAEIDPDFAEIMIIGSLLSTGWLPEINGSIEVDEEHQNLELFSL